MFQFLIRLIAFVFAVLLLLDVGLPIPIETVQVDHHRNSDITNRRNGNNYDLRFVDRPVHSCTVNYAIYAKLKEVDSVSIRITKVFGRCVEIRYEDEIVYETPHWKLSSLGGAFLLLAFALGWIKNNGDSDTFSMASGDD